MAAVFIDLVLTPVFAGAGAALGTGALRRRRPDLAQMPGFIVPVAGVGVFAAMLAAKLLKG